MYVTGSLGSTAACKRVARGQWSRLHLGLYGRARTVLSASLTFLPTHAPINQPLAIGSYWSSDPVAWYPARFYVS